MDLHNGLAVMTKLYFKAEKTEAHPAVLLAAYDLQGEIFSSGGIDWASWGVPDGWGVSVYAPWEIKRGVFTITFSGAADGMFILYKELPPKPGQWPRRETILIHDDVRLMLAVVATSERVAT